MFKINAPLVMANKKASQLTGYSNEELLTMNMRDFFSKSILNQIPLRYDLLDKGETVSTEREVTRKDGSIVSVEMNSCKMPNNTYQSFMRDISEQKRTEAALKYSEHLYRTVFENTGSSTVIIEEDSIIAVVNTEWENLSGYKREEAEGKLSWTQFVAPEDMERMKEYHRTRRINPNAAPRKYEFRFIRKNGEVKNVMGCVAMIPESKRSIASLMDITELKQVEKTLRISEGKLKAIIETSPDGIAITTLDGIVQFVTQKTISLWGYDSAEDILGRNVMDFVDPSYHSKAMFFINEMVNGNYTGAAEYLMVRKDGSNFFCESNANILHDANNSPIGILYVNRDITQRKEAESELIKAKERAEASEQRFKNMFERHHAVMLLLEPETGLILDANNAALKFYGYSRPVLCSLNINNINTLTPAEIKEALQSALNEQENGFIFHHRLANGEVRVVEVHSTPIEFQERKILFSIIHDITNRHNAEQELIKAKERAEESEIKYRMIFENAPLGIIHFSNRGIITSCNDKFIEIIGSSRDALVGLNMLELPDKQIVNALAKSLEGKLGYYNDSYHSTTAEKVTPVQILFAPIFSANYEVIAGVGIVEDVTEIKKKEEKLKKQNEEYFALNQELVQTNEELTDAKKLAEESEAFLLNIFENIPNMIFIKNADDLRFFRFNKAGEQLLGYKREELIGKNDYDFFPKEQADFFTSKDKAVFESKDLIIIEEENINTKSGTKILYTKKIAIKDNEGKNKYLLGISEDITKKKEIEHELIKAKERAEESDRLKSAFLANMSHEIRTPMNGILGFAELLKKPQLTGEQQNAYINIIEKSGVRMLNIINDIIDISKIEAGEVKVSITETNINEQVDFILNFFKPEAEKKGIALVLKSTLPENESIIKTDQEKVYAILTNLVKNAIKFTDRGSIEIGLEKRDKFLEFYVKDSGLGIPKDRFNAVFERFVQADISDRRAYQGAGLGLSITKAFVKMLGGEIWLESEENKGSIFYFKIPFAADAYEKVTKKIAIDSKLISKDMKLKVLIAEDDDTSDLYLTLLLGKYNCEILHAKTGTLAVDICRNNPDLDLIMMDIKMPDINGYVAAKEIRQFNQKVIILAETAYALAGDREKAIEAGCNDYLSKPLNQELLNNLIQKFFHM